jgi:hypothetical protein
MFVKTSKPIFAKKIIMFIAPVKFKLKRWGCYEKRREHTTIISTECCTVKQTTSNQYTHYKHKYFLCLNTFWRTWLLLWAFIWKLGQVFLCKPLPQGQPYLYRHVDLLNCFFLVPIMQIPHAYAIDPRTFWWIRNLASTSNLLPQLQRNCISSLC